MTDLRDLLQHFREIEKRATPGPFTSYTTASDHESRVIGCGRVVARCSALDHPQVEHDAAAFAASRNLFAALLDVAEAVDSVRYDFFDPIGKALERLREAMEANRG